MRILLDTNIWISGLLWGGNPRKIIQLAENETINLYTSLFQLKTVIFQLEV